MKKIATLILISFFTLSSQAQTWFDIGARGTVGTSFWINSNAYGNSAISPRLGVSWGAGARFGINFGEGPGIVFEGMFGQHTAGYKQQMEDGSGGTFELKRKSKMSLAEANVMFRWLKNSSYVELGPSFAFPLNPTDVDEQGLYEAPANYFNKIMYGVTFGVGGLIVGNEKVGLMLGLKVNYNISDLISADGKSNDYQMVNPSNNWNFGSYKGTHPLTIQLAVEVNYSLGYLVKASCGKRTYLMSF
ncbi:MAG: outer membrane beta-barrel protein [Crocinitomicaceae bacterium]